jgi:hypothetical protein
LRIARRARGVEGLFGRKAAGAQFGLALENLFGVAEQRFVARDLRFGIHLRGMRLVGVGLDLLDHAFLHELVGAHLREVGARRIELGADLIGVEPRHHLVGFDLRIIIGEDLDHLSGQLRADDHGCGRIDRAGGADGRDDLAAIDLGQTIGAFRRRAAPYGDKIQDRREPEGCCNGESDEATHGPKSVGAKSVHWTEVVRPNTAEITLRFG